MQNSKIYIHIYSLSQMLFMSGRIWAGEMGYLFKASDQSRRISLWNGWSVLFLTAPEGSTACTCCKLHASPARPSSIRPLLFMPPLHVSQWVVHVVADALWGIQCFKMPPLPHHPGRKHKSMAVISFVRYFPPLFFTLIDFLFLSLLFPFAPFCSSGLPRSFGLLEDPDVFRRLWQQERREAEALALPAPWPPGL